MSKTKRSTHVDTQAAAKRRALRFATHVAKTKREKEQLKDHISNVLLTRGQK
jgi:hypothetical protein